MHRSPQSLSATFTRQDSRERLGVRGGARGHPSCSRTTREGLPPHCHCSTPPGTRRGLDLQIPRETSGSRPLPSPPPRPMPWTSSAGAGKGARARGPAAEQAASLRTCAGCGCLRLTGPWPSFPSQPAAAPPPPKKKKKNKQNSRAPKPRARLRSPPHCHRQNPRARLWSSRHRSPS